MNHLFYLCLVFVMVSHLFIAALWSPAGKGLASWLLFVMFNCYFVTFPCDILGQMCYLIVWIPDLCRLSYFENNPTSSSQIHKKDFRSGEDGYVTNMLKDLELASLQ